MNKVYRDGEAAQDPTKEELEELAAAQEKGVYMEITTENMPLLDAAAGITDVLALAASNEPDKVVKIRLEIFEAQKEKKE